jgi:hypothetical protein
MFSAIRSLIPAATTAALLVLGACAGPLPAQAAHPPSPTPDVARTWHQVAQCVRDHGLPDFPDPTVDSSGHAHWPQGLQKPPDAILQACQPIFNRIPPQDRGDNTAATDSPAMLQRFARCMRQHGVQDWPDPDSQGNFHMPPSLAGNLKGGPRWAKISAAWNGPCRQYNPSGHISTAP